MTTISQYGYQSFIVNQLAVQRDQLTNLTQQISTGLASQTFGGLGAGRSVALQFQTQLDQANTFLNTINNVNTTLSVVNTSIQGINTLATQMQSTFSQQSYNLLSSGVTDQQQAASNGLEQMVSILNSNVGGSYVFGGKANTKAPVADTTALMNGTGLQAGFKQVMAERLQADQGIANAATGHTLGRVTVTTSPTNTSAVSVAEDAGAFGWKLQGVTTSGTGAAPALTQPTSPATTATVAAGTNSVQSATVDFSGGQPNAGDTVTFNLLGPDGQTQAVTLTAATAPTTGSAPPPAGTFYIGASTAATAANFNTALQSSLNTEGKTDLVAASAEAAGANFFNTYQGQPTLRVSPGPGGANDFANATSLVAGTAANTVQWYTGDQSATNPRLDATAQIDSQISVNFGVRANEPGFAYQVQQLAIASAFDASSGSATTKAAYLSLTDKIQSSLSDPPTKSSISGIQTDLADAYATANTAKSRLTTQAGTYQTMVSNVENADQTTVIASLASLQTQMQASYQASNILLHMTLAQYITG
jgi:flagellin-like hook-associated protein FlgL